MGELVAWTAAATCKADFRLLSRDGRVFHVHKHVLTESSALFEAFFHERNHDYRENHDSVYQLKSVDSDCLELIVAYAYGKQPLVPDHLLLPVLEAADFLMLDSHPHSLEALCLALAARVPFAVLEHASFNRIIVRNSTLLDRILRLDLLVTDKQRLSRLCASWRVDSAQHAVVESRLWALASKTRELMILFNRRLDYCVAFTGSETFQWMNPIQNKLPDGCQHFALRRDDLLYATADAIRYTCSSKAIYTQNANDSVLRWPPLLRRYGKNVFWTQQNRRVIKQWRDAYADNDLDAVFTLCDFASRRTWVVRHIAAADDNDYNHVVVVVTVENRWKLLFFDDDAGCGNSSFRDLRCPLKRIECVAVLNGVVYAIGSYTMSAIPAVMVHYKDDKWRESSKRLRQDLPNAFFPLNGRLYVIANGLDTCEVYEATIDRWLFIDMPPMTDIGGFTLSTT